MPKMIWSKLKSPFRKEGENGEEHVTGLARKSNNVDEEYVKAFRTKSYVDICHKVQGQIGRSFEEQCSFSSIPQKFHLSEFVLEPSQESLNEMIKAIDLHHLLSNYFESSLEAWRLCELLLTRIHQTRANFRTIKRVMKQLKRVIKEADCRSDDDVYRNPGSFALLKNPLSTISPVQFQTVHDDHVLLLHKLTSQCRKIRGRGKIIRCLQKSMASILVVVTTALAITLSVLAIHSVVGMVAAPGLMAGSFLLLQKLKMSKQEQKTFAVERLEAQLDVAAKGVYVLINDFNTISRLVTMLSDEMDHNKSILEMCIGKGKKEMLKEVAREFQMKETRFLRQLEELEEHLYLCFLNINRSRRLVVETVIGC